MSQQDTIEIGDRVTVKFWPCYDDVVGTVKYTPCQPFDYFKIMKDNGDIVLVQMFSSMTRENKAVS